MIETVSVQSKLGGSSTVDESKYWLCLEFRICLEFKGMPEKRLRRLWCDGFIPEAYLLDSESPCITGRAWIANGRSGQEQWKFTLFLRHPVGSRAEIEWDTLLPPDDVTRWLAVDTFGRRLEIEPAAAVPDASLTKQHT
jgi:hypothetical protein